MHQLFILPHLQRNNHQLLISNAPEFLAQLRKVLRATLGDTLFVQSAQAPFIRYHLKITARTDQSLQGDILSEQMLGNLPNNTLETSSITLCIAMPNKREKAELIVQKLSEIGIDEILFRPAERSIIPQRNEKKADRLFKIAKEATEQSRGIKIPHIAWCATVENYDEGKKLIIFDAPTEDKMITVFEQLKTFSHQPPQKYCGIIGPEG
ncbi:MAG: 16S rRNA (uracil(1498)-N(3))-methyltransferase [Candidatus Peribacteria bacterium]|jgi:RsmE family RNA methyltransferase|nr:16S rRNA (uracil(1498)-N(3))-methyltransferase [Candidatus Peribacteria bacterium]